MRKRVVSVATAICLLGAPMQLSANFFDSFVNGLGNSQLGQLGDMLTSGSAGADFANVTPASSNGGYFGGSVEFRFDTSEMDYRPWLQFNGPSMKAGCNGLSLDGGFADMLGLEDIAEQLGNASGAIMYGLLIGLVNSVPSIEHVFSKIKEIISEIQAALRNACNFGKNLSYNWAMNNGMRNVNAKVKEGISSVDNMINEGWDDFKKTVENEFFGSKKSDTGVNDDTMNEFAHSYQGLFRIKGLTTILAPSLFQNFAPKDYKSKTPVRDGIDYVEIEGKNKQEVLYLLAVALFGENDAINSNLAQFLNQLGSAITEGIATGDVSDSTQRDLLIKGMYQDSKGEASLFSDINLNETNYLPPKKSSEGLLGDFLYGPKNKDGAKQKLKVNSVGVYKGVASSGKQFYQLLLPFQQVKEVEIEWKGLVPESEALIECLINNYSASNGGSGCSTSANGIQIVVPTGVEMVNTIASFINRSKNSKLMANGTDKAALATANALKKQLALMNAYYYVKYFLAYIEENFTAGIGKTKGDLNIKSMDTMRKLMMRYTKSLEEKIQEQTQATNMATEHFKKLEQQLKEKRAREQGKLK